LPGDRLPPITGGLSVTEQSDAIDATGVVRVSLNQEVDRVVGPQTFDDQLRKQDADLREWMARFVIPAFLKANVVALGAITVLAGLDQFNIAWHLITPGERIIGGQVIMALLGATTVQVGAIAALIARYLFPGRQT
jgi:hypothetical protein